MFFASTYGARRGLNLKGAPYKHFTIMSALESSFWYGGQDRPDVPVRVGGPLTEKQTRKIRAAAARVARILVANFQESNLDHVRYFARLARLHAPRNGRRGLRLLRGLEARAQTLFRRRGH